MRVPPKVPYSVSNVVTRASMVNDLNRFDLPEDAAVCVHSAMKRIGYVVGGVQAVVEALLEWAGTHGTIMMPAYSGDISDPAEWRFPAIPEDEIEFVRSQVFPFDEKNTPTRFMGAVAEYFRTYPGTIRSAHPQSSFTANGRDAERLLAGHELNFRFGASSPLGNLCRLGGYVLLLGAPYNTVSLFHLVRTFLPDQDKVVKRYPIKDVEGVHWVEAEDFEYPVTWFDDGVDFLISGGIAKVANVGECRAVLIPAREAVIALVEWLGGDTKAVRGLR